MGRVGVPFQAVRISEIKSEGRVFRFGIKSCYGQLMKPHNNSLVFRFEYCPTYCTT